MSVVFLNDAGDQRAAMYCPEVGQMLDLVIEAVPPLTASEVGQRFVDWLKGDPFAWTPADLRTQYCTFVYGLRVDPLSPTLTGPSELAILTAKHLVDTGRIREQSCWNEIAVVIESCLGTGRLLGVCRVLLNNPDSFSSTRGGKFSKRLSSDDVAELRAAVAEAERDD